MVDTEPKPSGLSRTSTIVTIVSTLVGLIIAYLTFAAAVKWPPFEDATASTTGRTVMVFKAASAQGQPGCSIPSCAFIGVELRGFPANTNIRCTFDSVQGPSQFVDYQGRTDSEGAMRGQSRNYIGEAGGWVSATCDGTRGELNPW